VVTLYVEATPIARVHHRQIFSLDDLGHTLGLVGAIFYPLGPIRFAGPENIGTENFKGIGNNSRRKPEEHKSKGKSTGLDFGTTRAVGFFYCAKLHFFMRGQRMMVVYYT
jgi:hypothetical protein